MGSRQMRYARRGTGLLVATLLSACGSASSNGTDASAGSPAVAGEQGVAGNDQGGSPASAGAANGAAGMASGASGSAGTGGSNLPAGGSGGSISGASGSAGSAGNGGDPSASYSAALSKAVQWLSNMKQANGLYDSQAEKPNEDVAYTYDEAVAAIAFLAVQQPAAAAGILSALQGLQNANGSWANAYSSKSAVVDKEADLGPTAWVALAAAAYETQTGSTQYNAMAKKALAWAVTLQQSNGGILGGLDAKGKALTYESTEENEDIYPALNFFQMTSQADKVRGLLTSTVWDASNMLWNGGWSADGIDTTKYSDVNSWGVLSLLSQGPTGYLQALDYNMNNLRLTMTAGAASVDGFAFCSKKDDVWLEGTGQMASALFSAGRTAEGAHFTTEISKAQLADGGIPYSLAGGSTCDDPPDDKMSKDEAVSAVGWFVLAATQVNPFHYVKR